MHIVHCWEVLAFFGCYIPRSKLRQPLILDVCSILVNIPPCCLEVVGSTQSLDLIDDIHINLATCSLFSLSSTPIVVRSLGGYLAPHMIEEFLPS